MTTVFAALQDSLREANRLRAEIKELRRINSILVTQRDKLISLLMERENYAKATDTIRAITQGHAPYEP